MVDFKLLFESVPGLFLALRPDAVYTILGASDAYLRATLTEREKIVGRGLFDVFPDNPDDPQATGVRNLKASLERAFSRKVPDAMAVQKYDIRKPASEGGGFEERFWSPLNVPVLSGDGKVAYIIHRVEDVTESIRLSRDLKSSIEERDRYFNLSRDMICVAGTDGYFKLLNPAWERALGFTVSELLSAPYLDYVHPDDRDATVTTRGKQEGGEDVYHFENRYRCKDGSYRWLSWTATPVIDGLIYATARDVTESKRIREELKALNADLERKVAERTNELAAANERYFQAQKMEAIGRLAGGVAHDFNNLLMVISGYADVLVKRLPAEDPLKADAREIQEAAQRAVGLTRQLLAFSRKQVIQPKVMDLNALVVGVETMLRRLLGETIQVKILLAPAVGRVKADPSQIDQVLLNLAVNARDAMPSGGTLRIETADADLDRAYAQDHFGVPPGRYVMLAVSDTGIGMDKETLSHIFEPFFTTKGLGKGTGLGLSTVYGIAKQNGGHVWAYSEPGQGTTFKVYLPRVEEPLSGAGPLARPAPMTPARASTIVVVEDEPAVRQLVCGILRREGYVVIEVDEPAQAERRCREHGGPVHMLVTDVVMPGMNGSVVAQRLLAQYPKLQVLFMTGYTENVVLDEALLKRGAAVLEKPFPPDLLLRKVERALGNT